MAATLQAHDIAQHQKNRALLFTAGVVLAASLVAGTYTVRSLTQPATQAASGTAFVRTSSAMPGSRHLAAGLAGDLYATSMQTDRIVRIVDGSGPVASAAVPRPSGVAVDSRGAVYVAESRSCRIERLSANLKPMASWATCEARSTGYDGPGTLAVGFDGKVYATSQASSTVRVYTPTGALQRTIFTGGSRQRFAGIAVGPTGAVYLTDASMDHIVVIPAGSSRDQVWGRYGTAPGQFRRPTQIATGAAGNIYVLDAGNARIQKLSPTGKPVLSWGRDGSVHVSSPSGMTVDRSGAVYVTGGNSGTQRISSTGRVTSTWG